MEKVFIIKDVFENRYYSYPSNTNQQPSIYGQIDSIGNPRLIKFESKADAESVIQDKQLNNVMILEVYRLQ